MDILNHKLVGIGDEAVVSYTDLIAVAAGGKVLLRDGREFNLSPESTKKFIAGYSPRKPQQDNGCKAQNKNSGPSNAVAQGCGLKEEYTASNQELRALCSQLGTVLYRLCSYLDSLENDKGHPRRADAEVDQTASPASDAPACSDSSSEGDEYEKLARRFRENGWDEAEELPWIMLFKHSREYYSLWPLSPVLLLLQKLFRRKGGIRY